MRKSKPNPTAEAVLQTVGLHRRNNLRALIGPDKCYKRQVDLADVLGISESHLSQMIGPKPTRRVTETTARKFEYKLGMRTGALDNV